MGNYTLMELVEILLTLGLYIFLAYLFVTYILFLMQRVAPKVMTGAMTLRDYISLFGGSLVMLFLMAFGPYYMGQAVLAGWNSFKPIIITISDDIISDFNTITTGDRVQYDINDIENTNAPQAQPIYIPPTTTAVPTAVPFNYDTWTPDQPVPTPEQ